MHLHPTRFQDAWLVLPNRQNDDRGFFARTWCRQEFETLGLNSDLMQCSVSHNKLAGTLRGMHFQRSPHEETKVVRCSRGAIFDVIVDVRPQSETWGEWQGFELTCDNGHALYIPGGFAHGFQSLQPESEVFYQISEFYHPGSAEGFHYADSTLSIDWPKRVTSISTKDDSLASFHACAKRLSA